MKKVQYLEKPMYDVPQLYIITLYGLNVTELIQKD